MGSFITLLTCCFALLVVNLMFNGSGTKGECYETPSGIGYGTPENCSSNCANFCTNITSCRDVSDPCDPDYRYNPRYPCDPCDPCNYCRDEEGFYSCDEMIIDCDPCKRCPDNKTVDFCSSTAGTPPPPKEPAPIINYCYHRYSGGNCSLYNNAACFCTWCD